MGQKSRVFRPVLKFVRQMFQVAGVGHFGIVRKSIFTKTHLLDASALFASMSPGADRGGFGDRDAWSARTPPAPETVLSWAVGAVQRGCI